MLAVMHHNENIEAQNRGERVILRRDKRIGKASGAPTFRWHKSLYFEWQKEIIEIIKTRPAHPVINEEPLENELIDYNIEEDVYDEVIEEEIVTDQDWLIYFENNLVI